MKRPPSHATSAQRGVTLIEALVAMLIMTFGMLALIGLQGKVRLSADVAKQRGEATRLAQQDLELLRAYSVVAVPETPANGVRAYDDIVVRANQVIDSSSSNTQYKLERRVRLDTWPQQADVQVTVTWIDRADQLQTVELSSLIARVEPILSGSLAVPPDGSPTRRPGGRDVSIPLGAKDLGDNKTSVFKPQAQGTVAWVFNNLSGMIVGVCTTIAMDRPTSALTLDDVASCNNNAAAYLLSGYVRFSFIDHPNSEQPASNALPLALEIVQSPAPPPASASAPTPPIPPLPSHKCFAEAPVSSLDVLPYVNYNCIVYPDNETPRKWSGRLNITGIPLGGSDRKICRYSADYNGNGVIANAEHPLNYYYVTGALTRQNFLVINASASCPAGHAVDPARGFFSNTVTVLHQPDGV